MNALIALLKSRTFWVIVVTFVVNGAQAIDPMLPPQVQIAVTGVLSILASYFHLQPSKSTIEARKEIATKKVAENLVAKIIEEK